MRANMDAFLREYGYEPADDCLLQLYHIRETMEERQYALEAFQDMKAELNRFEAETDIPALEQIQTEENPGFTGRIESKDGAAYGGDGAGASYDYQL